MTQKTAYQKIVEISKRAYLLQGVEWLLGWDQETYMPKAAASLRAQQHELLAGLHHKELTGGPYKEALSKVIDLDSGNFLDPSLSDAQKASVFEMRRDYLKLVKLPQKFVEEFSSVTSLAHHGWIDARHKNDFKIFEPHLKKIVELNLQKAEFLGYEKHPYDALIDAYEPGMKTTSLFALFERLKIPLRDLLKQIQTRPKPKTPFFDVDYDRQKQFTFGKLLLEAMGFEEESSRLDESIHPMCIPIHPTDIRMTTRIYSKLVSANILSCIHEGGHGLYHRNLPLEHYGTPLSEAASLGIDESQSRTWETIIGRSLPFWHYFFPKLQQAFAENLEEVPLEAFHRGLNLVEPSMIRVDADEVSYNLHILIRFEIEKALIEKELSVSDVPSAWNERMMSYLGIRPSNDLEGCLQDIHWSMGALGYFPTYTLGNLYAAQFFETFAHSHPNWKEEIAKGNLALLADWQKEQIHKHGRRYPPQELCKQITGNPLSEEPFIRYLTKKFTAIYDL